MAITKLRKLALLAVFASLAGTVVAQTVSIAPAEGSAYAPPPDGSGSPLGYLVSGCMNQLFDSGCIVTDAEVFHGSRSEWSLPSSGLAGAKEGLVDYILALYVEWTPSAFHKGALLPAAVTYRLVRVDDGKILFEGELAGSPDSEDASAHFSQIASQAGAQAALPCVKLLKTLAMRGE